MKDEINIGTQVAIKFLRNYHEFGSRAHILTIRSLSEAIDRTSDADDRKLLTVKVFSEYMAALETLGAMSIAIRHRDEGVGLVYSFLTYGSREKFTPSTSLNKIFEILKAGNGVKDGLKLPSFEEISIAFRGFIEPTIETLYRESNIALSQAAAVYLAEKRALVRAYNKTKHGFVVVSDQHTFQPDPQKIIEDVAWIVAKNPSYDPSEPGRTPVVELFATRQIDVKITLERIPVIRGALMFITELTAFLLEEGIITSADSKA